MRARVTEQALRGLIGERVTGRSAVLIWAVRKTVEQKKPKP